MQKITVLLLMLTCVTFSAATAQTIGNKKKSQVKETEVPVAIRNSFERDFGKVPEDGAWTVYFSTTLQEGKTVATPIWYTFSKTADGARTEVRYLPNGKLKSARGIAKRQPDGRSTEEEESGDKPPTTM
jgi:hypothetical protein